MRTISWRKGMFRLWALLATIWTVLVLSFVSFTGELGEKWKEVQRAGAWEDMIVRVENGIKSGGMTTSEGAFIDAEQLKTDLVGIRERQPEVVAQTARAKEWIFGLIAVLLVPILGLLLVGRAGIWVMDGFHSNHER